MDERLIGLINIDKLKNKNILLVGVGGVGSFCFEALIRSGIKNITIIDYDKYELSNINRQLHANLSVINQNKVDVIKEYAKEIDKDINVISINQKVDENLYIDIQKYDYIIDACDDIKAKVILAKMAKENKIKIISACGIGNRKDPSKVSVMKLDKVVSDHLAKNYKNALRKEKVTTNIKVIASSEIPLKNHQIGSYMPVTAYAGLLMANEVIKDLEND